VPSVYTFSVRIPLCNRVRGLADCSASPPATEDPIIGSSCGAVCCAAVSQGDATVSPSRTAAVGDVAAPDSPGGCAVRAVGGAPGEGGARGGSGADPETDPPVPAACAPESASGSAESYPDAPASPLDGF
jgi:hypothetical protein